MKTGIQTELCAATASAVRIARQYQIDRVELCEQLEIGGITPSLGFQQFSGKLIETHVLIRPRGGDFVYSSDEMEIMLKDIAASSAAGMQGAVVGALNLHHQLDTDWLREAKKAAGNLDLTCHRAFDEVSDWHAAMETLIAFGFRRILSAGQTANALEGKDLLKSMKTFADGRIEIMAGGGINPGNAQTIHRFAQPDAMHFSGTKLHKTSSHSRYAVDMLLPDEILIEEILQSISL